MNRLFICKFICNFDTYYSGAFRRVSVEFCTALYRFRIVPVWTEFRGWTDCLPAIGGRVLITLAEYKKTHSTVHNLLYCRSA